MFGNTADPDKQSVPSQLGAIPRTLLDVISELVSSRAE